MPFCISCTKDSPKDLQVFGVWWWNSSLGEEYLTFAKNNGINEIYYCVGKIVRFSEAIGLSFIGLC